MKLEDLLLKDNENNSLTHDFRQTKNLINAILEKISDAINSDKKKNLSNYAAILSSLIKREEILQNYVLSKRKLLIELYKLIDDKEFTSDQIENVINKYKQINIYRDDVEEIDLLSFTKERAGLQDIGFDSDEDQLTD